MKNKFTYIVLIIFIANFSFAQKHKESALEKYSRVKFKIATTGDRVTGINENYSLINVAEILKELNANCKNFDRLQDIPITFVGTGAFTIYDMISNGTPRNIIQEPNNSDRIHLVYSFAPLGDTYPDFPGRRTQYWISTNKGSNFANIVTVPDERSGFPNITLTSDNKALVSVNTGSPGNENARFYIDALSGLGSFTELVPNGLPKYLYPRIITTNSVSNTIKFVSVVSSNDLDSAFLLKGQSFSAPGTFSSPQFINAKPPEFYCLARGNDGRIGIAYIANNLLQPSEIGDVYFIESTDNGTIFSNPIKIFDANISPSGDSLGAFRGLSMIYSGNFPKVVFETVKQTTNGDYFPGAPAKIMFWSNNLPGSDPNRSVVIADTSKVRFHPYISKGANNDLFASLCRPTIGASKDVDSYLFTIFMTPSDKCGGRIDTVSYMDILFTCSDNYGISWYTPQRINPIDTNNLRDWTYPSLSPSNDQYNGHYYYNFLVLSDSIPGSYINHQANGRFFAEHYFGRGDFFTFIEPPDPPESPSLISPANGATNVLLNPLLDWSDVATTNDVQVSLSPEFSTNIINDSVSSSQYNIPTGILNMNTTYYWRARGRIYFLTHWIHGSWSTTWSFTTRTTNINTLSTEIPKEYKLHQNHPNPFNPTTKIMFDLPKASSTKLIIYDILGKEIVTLINEKLNAGYFEIPFSGNQLSSGVYFYRLETDNFVSVKRFVLIK